MTWENKKIFIILSLMIGVVFGISSSAYCWQTEDPQAAEDFAKMLGFKVKDRVGKVAPEIKPGMVIDGTNYKQYPGLAQLLPPSLYARMDPKVYAPMAPIKIKETDQYHLGKRFIASSLKSAKTVKIGADGLTLEGYWGGYPFINPKNGVEIAQWANKQYLGDTFAMRPMRLHLYGKDNKPERELRQHLNCYRFMYRNDWGPDFIEPNPEQIEYINSGTFIYPKDIAGTSYVRKRFVPADKPDEFLLFVASMRRIRRMSGRDTQDPLFGSDLVWDDYNTFWQKLSTKDFPFEYKAAPVQEMLLPTFVDYDWPNDRATGGYTDYNIDESGAQTYLNYGSWQRRWVHPVEMISKDPSYCYSKRVWVPETEICAGVQTDLYDQSGRLWRGWVRDYNLNQNGVGIMEELIDIVDHINHHRTILDFKGHKDPLWMGTEYADVRFL
ncbi:MAG TPA: DUF1329 domain-containing protein, partial [Thermodesulfobacteriota bacterium]|nr:DUF1329 domain-containing protein [Thermodesulfobacteriota bacterium]